MSAAGQQAVRGVRIVVLGPPGSGKGTQAEMAGQAFSMVRISTGDLLRQAVRDDSPLGRRVEAILESGDLVPDDLVGEVVEAHLRELEADRGVLLDGFPRTRPQVDILDRILDRLGRSLTAAILLDVPEAEILRRLSGRRVCRACGQTYHIEFKPPRAEGVCDVDGGELILRDDDRETVIRNRLQVYRRETAPVVDCYRGRGILRTVAAGGTTREVAAGFQDQIRQVAG